MTCFVFITCNILIFLLHLSQFVFILLLIELLPPSLILLSFFSFLFCFHQLFLSSFFLLWRLLSRTNIQYSYIHCYLNSPQLSYANPLHFLIFLSSLFFVISISSYHDCYLNPLCLSYTASTLYYTEPPKFYRIY